MNEYDLKETIQILQDILEIVPLEKKEYRAIEEAIKIMSERILVD